MQFFGLPKSINDINVLDCSRLVVQMLQREGYVEFIYHRLVLYNPFINHKALQKNTSQNAKRACRRTWRRHVIFYRSGGRL